MYPTLNGWMVPILQDKRISRIVISIIDSKSLTWRVLITIHISMYKIPTYIYTVPRKDNNPMERNEPKSFGEFCRALSQNVIPFSVGEMVLLDPMAVDEAYMKFQNELNDLTYKRGRIHMSKACLICNALLEWNDTK
jgi:hypothetical protein